MGLFVKSMSVREAAKPRLKTAITTDPNTVADADDAAAGSAADVEAATRSVSFNAPMFFGAVVLVIFIVVAGIYTEQNQVTGWGERLVDLFGALVPGFIGYVAGEFVAEKTK